jgi:hypothetical protein
LGYLPRTTVIRSAATDLACFRPSEERDPALRSG